MASKSEQRGSTGEHARRRVPQRLRPFEAVIERMMMGQLAQPPETAISTPMQQAIANLQSGGQGSMPGGMANLANNGMLTREQLGLPARSSYFPTAPTLEEIEALGAMPNIPGNRGTLKDRRREAMGDQAGLGLGLGLTPEQRAQYRKKNPEPTVKGKP